MIPVYKLEDSEYNKVILWSKDPNIGKVVYMEKELSDNEIKDRLEEFYKEKIIWQKNYISDWDWQHPHHVAYPWEMPLIRKNEENNKTKD